MRQRARSRQLPGSPFADEGVGPEGVVITPTGKFAYVPNVFAPPNFPDDFVAAYVIDATRGTLTPAAGSPFKVVGRDDQGLAVDPAEQIRLCDQRRQRQYFCLYHRPYQRRA